MPPADPIVKTQIVKQKIDKCTRPAQIQVMLAGNVVVLDGAVVGIDLDEYMRLSDVMGDVLRYVRQSEACMDYYERQIENDAQ